MTFKQNSEKTELADLRVVEVTTPTEWDVVRHFRSKYFFSPNNMDDPYTWTFNHPEHKHFILYQDAEIIGYGHIQLWSDARAAIRIIVIDEIKRNNKFGRQFLTLCEQWLRGRGYKYMHAEASPTALAFYKKNSYIEMPFNDPDGYESSPEDTAVGKEL